MIIIRYLRIEKIHAVPSHTKVVYSVWYTPPGDMPASDSSLRLVETYKPPLSFHGVPGDVYTCNVDFYCTAAGVVSGPPAFVDNPVLHDFTPSPDAPVGGPDNIGPDSGLRDLPASPEVTSEPPASQKSDTVPDFPF